MIAYAHVLILIIMGASPAQPTGPYQSALVAALNHFAREGDLEYLRAIVEKHPDLVDASETPRPQRKPLSTDGYSPLHWAARMGHTEVVDYLAKRGANINVRDDDGWTPLHLAAQHGHLDVVKLLVARGADVGAKTEPQPETSDPLPGSPPRESGKPEPTARTYPATPARTALDWAVVTKQTDVAKYLRSLKPEAPASNHKP